MEKRLEHMKEMLMACVEGQLTHLDEVDTEELGDVVDMIKDLSEALYYCKIVKAMDEVPSRLHSMRDMDRDKGRLYYDRESEYQDDYERKRLYSQKENYPSNGNGKGNSSNGRNGSSSRSEEMEYDFMRDPREGRSPRNRRMYMEHKQAHADKTTQMRELENYMQELTQDIMEMIEDSSSEEKQYLSKKIGTLATKINGAS